MTTQIRITATSGQGAIITVNGQETSLAATEGADFTLSNDTEMTVTEVAVTSHAEESPAGADTETEDSFSTEEDLPASQEGFSDPAGTTASENNNEEVSQTPQDEAA